MHAIYPCKSSTFAVNLLFSHGFSVFIILTGSSCFSLLDIWPTFHKTILPKGDFLMVWGLYFHFLHSKQFCWDFPLCFDELRLLALTKDAFNNPSPLCLPSSELVLQHHWAWFFFCSHLIKFAIVL